MNLFVISSRDQQRALLDLLKEMISIFWGPDLQKCTEILQKPFLGSIDKLSAQAGFRNFETLTEIKSVLNKFTSAEALFHHLEEAYVRLFVSDRAGVTAPLYASCYVNKKSGEKVLLMGQPAIDMKRVLSVCG
jgi:TorA maturation chaperone TorD